jgi:hypothetical protein
MNQSGHINAAIQARLDAGARHERTLEAADSCAWCASQPATRADGSRGSTSPLLRRRSLAPVLHEHSLGLPSLRD